MLFELSFSRSAQAGCVPSLLAMMAPGECTPAERESAVTALSYIAQSDECHGVLNEHYAAEVLASTPARTDSTK